MIERSANPTSLRILQAALYLERVHLLNPEPSAIPSSLHLLERPLLSGDRHVRLD